MNDWQTCAVPDSYLKNKVSRQNHIPAKEIAEVGRFPVVDQGQKFVAGYCDDESRVIDFDLPLIIFGDHTRCLKYVDFPFVLGADGTKVLLPNKKLYDPRFYYFALLALEIPSRGYNRHFTILNERSLPLPPLPEQKKIAHILSTVQRAIEAQERIIQTTTELKKALMHKLFTEGLRHEPQKQTEIGPVPESWATPTVESVCTVKASAMSYSQLENASNVANGVNVIGITVSDMNLPGNEIEFRSANLERQLPEKDALKRTVPANSIVFPKRGAAIATNKKRLTTGWTVLDPNLIAVMPTKVVNHRYLFHWFNTFDLKKITDPGPTPQLNKKDIAPLKFPMPPIKEQEAIAAAIDAAEVKATLHIRKRDQFQDLFRTLLHELMTAKTRVHELNFQSQSHA
jgi:type I restriction enzyme S subunit